MSLVISNILIAMLASYVIGHFYIKSKKGISTIKYKRPVQGDFLYLFVWLAIPAVALILIDIFINVDSNMLLFAQCFLFWLLTLALTYKFYTGNARKLKSRTEKLLKVIFFICALFSLFISIAILLTLVIESVRFFYYISPFQFFLSSEWNPELSGENASFGALGIFWGSFFIVIIAMCFAVPLGIGSGIYLSKYCNAKYRGILKSSLEILAGVPTVVYGLLGLLFIGPALFDIFSNWIGAKMSGESALLAGIVVGIMILPLILSLSDDALAGVPKSYSRASYAMGATKAETIQRVVLPAALPQIGSSVLIAASRAIGETMVVTMLAGLVPYLTLNPLDASTTTTAQIVNLLSGDQEFDSPKTLAAFALGASLFFITLFMNFASFKFVSKKVD